MRPLRVAIVGMGTAGNAAALFLARAGHSAVVFEKTERKRLMEAYAGAGLGLQPIGLRVLERLGVLESVLEHGARIDSLKAFTKEGRPVLDLQYADLDKSLFGLGVHRSVLFRELYSAMEREEGIEMRTGSHVSAVHVPETKFALEHSPAATAVSLEDGTVVDGFDLAIVSDGRSSSIRRAMAAAGEVSAYEMQYPFGCLWAVLPDTDGFLDSQGPELFQRLDSAKKMLGLLPTGTVHKNEATAGPLEGKRLLTLFWSLELYKFEEVKKAGIDSWKREVLAMEPRTEALLSHISGFEDLIPAQYNNTVMRQLYVGDSCVFLGDSAHSTSPQLGQGANLALVDAWALSESLKKCQNSLLGALKDYDRVRRWRLRFYQLNSMMLTPVFQSNSRIIAAARDLTMGTLCRFPPARWQMLATMSGVQNNGIPLSKIPESEYKLGLPTVLE